MRRWAKNIACLICLLIFAPCVTLWVRGYFVEDFFLRLINLGTKGQPNGPPRVFWYAVGSTRGSVGVMTYRDEYSGLSGGRSGWYYHPIKPPQDWIGPGFARKRLQIDLAGFHLLHRVAVEPSGWLSQFYLVLPLWLFLPFGIPPLLWWRRRRRERGRGFAVETVPASGDAVISYQLPGVRDGGSSTSERAGALNQNDQTRMTNQFRSPNDQGGKPKFPNQNDEGNPKPESRTVLAPQDRGLIIGAQDA